MGDAARATVWGGKRGAIHAARGGQTKPACCYNRRPCLPTAAPARHSAPLCGQGAPPLTRFLPRNMFPFPAGAERSRDATAGSDWPGNVSQRKGRVRGLR